jgi:MYXO-CTERM domain-containing protein
MDCLGSLRIASFVLVTAFAWSPIAAATPVVIPMDAASDLETQGFTHHQGDGDSTFAGGMMTVDTVGYEEWMLSYGTASHWWDDVHPSKGWWVEARLRVDLAEPGCPGPGIWIHDREKLFKLRFGDGELVAEPGGSVPLDTSDFHVYRFEEYGDGTRRVLVDDAEVLDLSAEVGSEGSAVLMLGDLGGCGHSIVTWDHLAYDTFAPGEEDGDVDADGVSNADDNCFEMSNADQANMDGDGLGDVCDPCPVDMLDDSDGDGVCDSDDACPDDPTATEEPCPSGSSGFQGDGFGEVGGDIDGDGTGSDASVSAGSASASADGTVGSGEGSAGQGEPGEGCSCRSGEGSRQAAWWAAIVLVAAARRRARASNRRS